MTKERLTNARIATLIDYAQQATKPWLGNEVVEALMELLDWRNRAEAQRVAAEPKAPQTFVRYPKPAGAHRCESCSGKGYIGG